MQTIEIYTKPTCGFCHMAKRVLTAKGVSFTEVNITAQPEKRAEMIQRAKGGSTVPQIFIGGKHVGGCDDLMTLDRQGKLDGLLSA
ncbi:glutaredoxin 3 [Yoonia sp.]|jgi:glutaredoxin 3|uniref:glutaredoxin 3 n=1 Tax=Yoonia sp. TaxID=2212373 RepID=UPI001BCEB5A2|nr:glutaredoxin 3 [Yoonia sp.]MDA0720110.1 glutaredoxin 3 [Pseudomonadota bacterium]MDA1153896.1 glutaredoxin 3 [Pseudomonadota bacterium]